MLGFGVMELRRALILICPVAHMILHLLTTTIIYITVNIIMQYCLYQSSTLFMWNDPILQTCYRVCVQAPLVLPIVIITRVVDWCNVSDYPSRLLGIFQRRHYGQSLQSLTCIGYQVITYPWHHMYHIRTQTIKKLPWWFIVCVCCDMMHVRQCVGFIPHSIHFLDVLEKYQLPRTAWTFMYHICTHYNILRTWYQTFCQN